MPSDLPEQLRRPGEFKRWAPDLFAALEEASGRLGRKVNPTVYSRKELAKRLKHRNAFVTRVLAQPRIWLIGAENDIAA